MGALPQGSVHQRTESTTNILTISKTKRAKIDFSSQYNNFNYLTNSLSLKVTGQLQCFKDYTDNVVYFCFIKAEVKLL